MKNILFLLSIITIFSFTSCTKCTNCVIKDGSEAVVTYPEFCGSPYEVKSFTKDIEFDAGNLQCITCTILASDQSSIMHVYENIYGSEEEIIEFKEKLIKRTQLEGWFYDCSEIKKNFGEAICD
ncbi:MAG: hypothetical protein C0594_01460 [Marinilabiliales bacterium]|nr:MAG: hypothetical protein C0594_01460 [Marinilabiliales bacterium]